MAAADHGEAVGAAEIGALGDLGDRLLAGVDQVGVFLALIGEGAHAQHAVFRLQGHDHALGDVVGHQGRNADAQVHIEAVLQLFRGALGQLFAGAGHQTFSFWATASLLEPWSF
ncbi:hypothetical protein D3C71_1858210 [compost metagenome]